MVDFRKKLADKKVRRPTDPIELYETLDRAVDKGPLRPAQASVLKKWFENRKNERDLIVKLHTGQGKTLIGLLTLQSRINEGFGPCLYLCPNNYLVDQTVAQAKKFGISTCEAAADLPEEFLAGKTILVASVQKLFNGLTKFGLHNNSVAVHTLLMDDAHACSDTIRNACKIRIERSEQAYTELLDLFSLQLESQGAGTYADIVNKKRFSLLPVPYWAWQDLHAEVASILSRSSESKSIKFTWPLIRDTLSQCQCIVSGIAIEIEPFVPPLDAFGSYSDANNRIFMSATVTDDAFLVKGLGLDVATIQNPLTYDSEKWSGEKMILLPSLIDDTLHRGTMVDYFARPDQRRACGVVALTPGFKAAEDWKRLGSIVAETETVTECIKSLSAGHFVNTLVLANRYDGVDLPDSTCRILVIDSRPYSESLIDLYNEACRPESDSTLMRIVRTVEQGLGRSVRGEKDYSAIVITGDCITRLVRDIKSRKYLSAQLNKQIEVGLEIAEMAKSEIASESQSPMRSFVGLLDQSLHRDEGWKAFYGESMDSTVPKPADMRVLSIYSLEQEAEMLFRGGDHERAVSKIQGILDSKLVTNQKEIGWYLQEMARYNYQFRRTDSEKLQKEAFMKNRMLLLPRQGVKVEQLTVISEGRLERIAWWISAQGSYEQLSITINDIVSKLSFGIRAEDFENALDELSEALGFVGERPDKEWKEGPDNLWALDSRRYILWECKSEVNTKRAEIQKSESQQMNGSCAWFEKHYKGCEAFNHIVIPTHKLASAASFTHTVSVTDDNLINKMRGSVLAFFRSFESKDLKSLSMPEMQKALNDHKLSVDDLVADYGRKPKDYH